MTYKPSETAQLLYRLIANKTTRVTDRLGIATAEMTPADIEWLYNAIGMAWKAEEYGMDPEEIRLDTQAE